MDSSNSEATKAEEVHLKIEQADEVAPNPGLAFAPIFFDPDAQVAALAVEEAAPVIEEEEAEDEKPDIKPAIEECGIFRHPLRIFFPSFHAL